MSNSDAILSEQTRADHLAALAATDPHQGDAGPLDVLVIGGGVTGAGIALDAATRGLRVGIVEAQDWASGTSSRSSKLVHGGLRYLYQLDFPLVAESLRERGLLLTTTAPHLVRAQPFLWPLKTPVIERAYSAVGVGMYDAMAQWAHRGSVPIQRHHTRRGSLKLAPALRRDALTGSIVYYDARVDAARGGGALVRPAGRDGGRAGRRRPPRGGPWKQSATRIAPRGVVRLATAAAHQGAGRCQASLSSDRAASARSSSVGAKAGAALAPMPTAVRIFCSISRAMVGFSFSHSRELSLPWPILEPL